MVINWPNSIFLPARQPRYIIFANHQVPGAYLPCSVRTIEKQVPHTHEMPKKNYLLKGTEEEKRLKIWQNQCWNSFAKPKGNICAIRGQQTCRPREQTCSPRVKTCHETNGPEIVFFCIQGDRGDRGDRGGPRRTEEEKRLKIWQIRC